GWMLAVCACAAVVGVWIVRDGRRSPAPTVGAEAWVAPASERRAPVAPVVRESTDRPAPKPAAAALPKSETPSLDKPQDPSRCAALARDGQYEPAADCYDRIAHG